jgi:hypothetical protein
MLKNILLHKGDPPFFGDLPARRQHQLIDRHLVWAILDAGLTQQAQAHDLLHLGRQLDLSLKIILDQEDLAPSYIGLGLGLPIKRAYCLAAPALAALIQEVTGCGKAFHFIHL